MPMFHHPHTSTADVPHNFRQRFLNGALRNFVKPRLRAMPAGLEPILKARARIEALAERYILDIDPALETTWGTIAGVPVERIRPTEPTGQVVLYIHGGAFIVCSPRTHRGITRPLARYSGCEVIAVEYRIAPEHRYPAAVNDVLDVYRDLLNTLPAHQICLAGDSAGGNLVLALLHAAQEEGLPMPVSAVCLSPWTDLTGGGESIRSNIASDAYLPGERMHELAMLYLDGAYIREPTASPLFGDLTGFPPLLLHVGSTEILLDDSLRLVARARKYGVEAHLRIWPRLPHVFHAFSSHLPVAHIALKEIADFMLGQFRRPQ